MPTLREDLEEARARALAARPALADKATSDATFTRDDKILSIEGYDSVYECVDECIRFVPFSQRAPLSRAKSEADEARKVLADKLSRALPWTKTDKQSGVDGLSLLVSTVDAFLPYVRG